jgi:hypothetical protein
MTDNTTYGEDQTAMKKNYILRVLPLAAGILFLFFAVCGAFSSDEDTLWQKAVEIASKNVSWIPESVIHYEEVYSRIGFRQEVTETHSTLRKQESGEVELTFHKVITNGRDITEEFVQEFGKTLTLDESEYRVEHPFHPASEYRVEYRQKGRKKNIEGRSCVQYEFTFRNEKGTWEGTAWLEELTGIPMLVEGTLLSVPLDERWYMVLDLKIITEYITNGNGGWYPSKSIVDSFIEVDGGPLHTYKGRIKETYRFMDYRKYE